MKEKSDKRKFLFGFKTRRQTIYVCVERSKKQSNEWMTKVAKASFTAVRPIICVAVYCLVIDACYWT